MRGGRPCGAGAVALWCAVARHTPERAGPVCSGAGPPAAAPVRPRSRTCAPSGARLLLPPSSRPRVRPGPHRSRLVPDNRADMGSDLGRHPRRYHPTGGRPSVVAPCPSGRSPSHPQSAPGATGGFRMALFVHAHPGQCPQGVTPDGFRYVSPFAGSSAGTTSSHPPGRFRGSPVTARSGNRSPRRRTPAPRPGSPALASLRPRPSRPGVRGARRPPCPGRGGAASASPGR